ncbi:unnamed protein product [Pleuronectes platessa]|uniref:Uncharacterized protein n=1 Tax=Pleuronectes platessa TaxID=8262 RepID=A0A9N7VI55_PLEPL|nr:unnamed protein product [Pleuronectes platessa]
MSSHYRAAVCRARSLVDVAVLSPQGPMLGFGPTPPDRRNTGPWNTHKQDPALALESHQVSTVLSGLIAQPHTGRINIWRLERRLSAAMEELQQMCRRSDGDQAHRGTDGRTGSYRHKQEEDMESTA